MSLFVAHRESKSPAIPGRECHRISSLSITNYRCLLTERTVMIRLLNWNSPWQSELETSFRNRMAGSSKRASMVIGPLHDEAGYGGEVLRLGIPGLALPTAPGLLTRHLSQAPHGCCGNLQGGGRKGQGVVICREVRALGIGDSLQQFVNIDRDLQLARTHSSPAGTALPRSRALSLSASEGPADGSAPGRDGTLRSQDHAIRLSLFYGEMSS